MVAFSVAVSTSGGNQSWTRARKLLTSKSCDVVFVWCSNGSLWEVPVEYAAHKSSIVLGPKTLRYHVGGPTPPIRTLSDDTSCKEETYKLCGDAECSAKIHHSSTYCRSHANKLRDNKPRRKEVIAWPDDARIIAMLKSSNFVQVGRRLGVSDNAIRKRLKSHGHDLSKL